MGQRKEKQVDVTRRESRGIGIDETQTGIAAAKSPPRVPRADD
jgi:hypothetical protein